VPAVARRSTERVENFDPDALLRVRKAKSVTLDDLAALAGSARSTLINYEKGRVRPGPESLYAIARALDVEPLALTTADPEALTLKDLRVSNGVSRSRLSDEIKVSQATWDAIERGRRPMSEAVAARAARFLRVTPEKLVEAWDRGLAERVRQEPADSDPGWLRTAARFARDRTG
jgi:transcriptional regulator with XRE-family HTH domain